MTWREPTRWGVTLCAPGDTHVVEKMVCYSRCRAQRQGKRWKKRNPDSVVRVVSLCPKDTSDPEVLP